MTPMTRRTFFKKAGADVAVAGVLGARMMTAHASPLGLPIGSQTYPHRALIQSGHFADLAATLAAMGVTALEMCSPFSYDEFAPLKDGKATRAVLAGHGLVSESGHFDMDELRHQQGRAIAWAHEVGITQMVTATLNGPMKPTMDDVKRAADEYNRIAAAAKKEGIQQGLHNEGFEISQVDGRRTYDVLIELLDPALVKFQFQMSTIGYGFVAAEYFRKYPGRFNSMHVQDVDLKAPHPAAASDDDDPKAKGVQVPVGKGSIDWAATFEAAKVGGVKSYYVEQNMAFTKESVAYLKALHV